MDNIFELLYQAIAVIVFCIALTFLLSLYETGDEMMLETKDNIYSQHTVYEE